MKKKLALSLALLMLLCQPLSAFAADTTSASTITMVAVGDDLIHDCIYQSAKKNGKYNFDSLFSHVKSDIQAADVAAINQETILVDKNYSSYPQFGSPTALGTSIAKAGFDVVTHATNHTYDKRTTGVKTTLNFWSKKYPKMKVLGIHKSKKAASKITVIERKGIKIAMLNYTYGLNGLRVPSGQSYLIDRLGNEKKIKNDIKKAKKAGDIVVVFTHMGTEYKYTPDSYQKKWSKFFANNGVDIMIGAHPHVVEPYKMLKGKKGHKMLCYYSLGNFVSAQSEPPRMLGGMAKIKIIKDAKGTRVKSYTMVPLVTHFNRSWRNFTVYKLSDYNNKLASQQPVLAKKHYTVKKLKKLFNKIV